MKKLRVILLGILLAGIVAIAIVIGVVDVKYGVIRSAPRIHHESVAAPSTSIRLLCIPSAAQESIKTFVKMDREVPDWILERVFPYEIAVMFAPVRDKGETAVTVFVNEQRFGPLIAKVVNGVQLELHFPDVSWSPSGMVRPARGVLLLEGSIPMDAQTVQSVAETWSDAKAISPLPMERGHFLEAVFDNSQGGAYALLASLVTSDTLSSDDFITGLVIGTLKNVVRAHGYGDFVDRNTLDISLTFECDPFAEDDPAGSLKFLLDSGITLIGAQLGQQGFTLDGESLQFEQTVEARYTLTGLAK